MMRFMLTENMQDRIPLNRETEYINNYIALQKLRTGESPNIMINTSIDDQPYCTFHYANASDTFY
jgi:LytS/YehU family sensor histidine kinase